MFNLDNRISNEALVKSYFLPLDRKWDAIQRKWIEPPFVKKEMFREVILSHSCKDATGGILPVGTKVKVICCTTRYKQLELADICPVQIQRTLMYLGEYRKMPVTIKRFQNIKAETLSRNKDIISLLELFSKARGHPHIQQCVGIAPTNLFEKDREEISFVMENHFFEGRQYTLYSLLQERPVEEWQLLKIIRQIVTAMCYLHNKETWTGISRGGFQVVLDDALNARLVLMPSNNPFGEFNPEESKLASESENLSTIKWRSPETFKCKHFSQVSKPPKVKKKADVFTVGRLLQLITTKKKPFHSKTEREAVDLLRLYDDKYMDDALLHILPIINPDILELLQSCTKGIPKNRPTMEEVSEQINSISSLFIQNPTYLTENPLITLTNSLIIQISKFAEAELKKLLGIEAEKSQPLIDILLPLIEKKFSGISFYKHLVEEKINQILYFEVNKLIVKYIDQLKRTDEKQLAIKILLSLIKQEYPTITFDETRVKEEVHKVISEKVQLFIAVYLGKITAENENENRPSLFPELLREVGSHSLLDNDELSNLALRKYIEYGTKKFNAMQRKPIDPNQDNKLLTPYFSELTRAVQIDFSDRNLLKEDIEALGKTALINIYEEAQKLGGIGGRSGKYDRWRTI